MDTLPVFVNVDQLSLGSNGNTLLAKVLTSNSKTVCRKAHAGLAARQTRIECLIGDETGCILFIAPNNQGSWPRNSSKRDPTLQPQSKGIMKLVVDKRGLVEVTEPASFDVKEDNNVSLVEYELVCI